MAQLEEPEAGDRNAALLAVPLGIEVPEASAPPGRRRSSAQREALFSAARAVIEAMSLRRPLVLALDDIHWADEGCST